MWRAREEGNRKSLQRRWGLFRSCEGLIPEDDAVSVVHAGGLGGEEHNALDEGPDDNGYSGYAAGQQAPRQGEDKLDGAPGVEAQVEIMHAEHAQYDGQQARCQAALLGIACGRGVILLGLVWIIGLLGRLAVLGRLVLRGALALLLLLGILGRAIGGLGLVAGIGGSGFRRPGRLRHMEGFRGRTGEMGAGVVWGRGIRGKIRLQGQMGDRLFRTGRLLLGSGGLGGFLDGLGFRGLPFCLLGRGGIALLL